MSLTSMRKNMQGWFRYVMYLIVIIFIIGIIGLAIGGGMLRNQNQNGQTSDSQYVAVVGNEKIDRTTFTNAVESERQQYEQMGQTLGPFDEVQMTLSVLERLANQKIMVQAAESEGIKVSKREINDRIDQVVKEEVDKYRQILLGKSKTPKTDEELNKVLAKRQKGLTVKKIEEDIRKNINKDAVRDQLLMEKLQQSIESKIDTSEDALKASFDEVRLAQITIDTTKLKPNEAEAKAKELVKRIKGGEDFAKVAQEASNDAFASKGGDRGIYLGRTYMEPELAKVAFSLNKGDVSDPIKMPQGYVIIKVLDKRTNLPKDFNDPKKHKQYMDAYVQREKNNAFNAFFEQAKKKIKVSILDPELKAHQLARSIYMSANQAEMKSNALKAIAEYKKALSAVNGESMASARIYSQMAMIYTLLAAPAPGNNEAAKKETASYRAEAKNALIEALNYTESNQIRLMLARMNIEDKEYDKALESLQLVSDNAYQDPPQIHYQVMMLAQQIKNSDKAKQIIAKENKWLEDYSKRMKTEQSQQSAPRE
jgi:parvulin-like peptidyl-prolyl isomerase